MATEPSDLFKDFFKDAVKTDIADWDVTSENKDAKGTLTREFQHRATKDTVTVSENTRYCPIDEMDVTTFRASGSFKGKDVKSALLWKPEID